MRINRDIEQKLFVLKSMVDERINNRNSLIRDFDFIEKFAELQSLLFLTDDEARLFRCMVDYYDGKIIDNTFMRGENK